MLRELILPAQISQRKPNAVNPPLQPCWLSGVSCWEVEQGNLHFPSAQSRNTNPFKNFKRLKYSQMWMEGFPNIILEKYLCQGLLGQHPLPLTSLQLPFPCLCALGAPTGLSSALSKPRCLPWQPAVSSQLGWKPCHSLNLALLWCPWNGAARGHMWGAQGSFPYGISQSILALSQELVSRLQSAVGSFQ